MGPRSGRGRDAGRRGTSTSLRRFSELLALAPAERPGLRRSGRSLLGPPSPSAATDLRYFEALSTTLNRGWAPLRGFLEGDRKHISLPIAESYDLRNDVHEATNLYPRRRSRSTRSCSACLANPSGRRKRER